MLVQFLCLCLFSSRLTAHLFSLFIGRTTFIWFKSLLHLYKNYPALTAMQETMQILHSNSAHFFFYYSLKIFSCLNILFLENIFCYLCFFRFFLSHFLSSVVTLSRQLNFCNCFILTITICNQNYFVDNHAFCQVSSS